MPAASAEDVDRAVNAAHRALFAPEWAGLTATERGKLLYKLADLVTENAQELAELETADTGKIIRETRSQIGYVAEYYRYYAGLADKIHGAQLPSIKPIWTCSCAASRSAWWRALFPGIRSCFSRR